MNGWPVGMNSWGSYGGECRCRECSADDAVNVTMDEQDKGSELEAAHRRIAELEAALRPLAAWAEVLKIDTPDDQLLPGDVPHLSLTMGHARAAAKALGWLTVKSN
jgi:hypothetical protein